MNYLVRSGVSLPAEILKECKRRKWSMHWTARGAYLHLEASELIESLRGKGESTPEEEAADVLLVLMSITEDAGIPFENVIDRAWSTLERLRREYEYVIKDTDKGRFGNK